MRADRVKPGMLLREETDRPWQVVALVEKSGGMAWLHWSSRGDPWEITGDSDVEAVRLTDAQVRVLHLFADRKVTRTRSTYDIEVHGFDASWTWRVEGFIPPPRQQPYNTVRDYGLVAAVREQRLGTKEWWELSPSGRALLDILAREKAA